MSGMARLHAQGAWHLLVRAVVVANAKMPVADEAMPGIATPNAPIEERAAAALASHCR